MLSEVLASQHADFTALANAWLSTGATSYSVWAGGHALAHWPADKPRAPQSDDLLAPIAVGETTVGELRLSGLSGPATQTRLTAEAGLVAQLVKLESILDGMTTELITSQDHLLALYDLAESMRRRVSLDKTLHSLTEESVRLLNAEGAYAYVAKNSQTLLIQAQFPANYLPQAVLPHLFSYVQSRRQEFLLDRQPSADWLPAGIDHFVCMPIRIHGEAIAGLCLFTTGGRRFVSPELKLIRAIASQAGVQIENVLLYQETLAQARYKTELELAANIQTLLLPQKVPQIDGLELAAQTHPAQEVGGDFYDFIDRPGRPFFFTIGDVSGKGLSAAMLMTMTRTVARSKATISPTPTPEMVLSRLNEDMYDDFSEVSMFATVFVGWYDPPSRRLIYANAGHSPVIYRPQNGPACLLEADGTAMGVLPICLSEDHMITFQPGDLLVAATDGFSDARNPHDEMFGYERLLTLVESLSGCSAPEIAQSMVQAISRFSAGRAQDDDQTLIVIKGVLYDSGT